MIGMARIQSPTIGFAGFQKPIIRYDRMGQDAAPAPSPAPSPAPAPGPGFDANPLFPVFPQPIFQPPYVFPVVQEPVVAPTPAPTPAWVTPAIMTAVGVAAIVVLAKALGGKD